MLELLERARHASLLSRGSARHTWIDRTALVDVDSGCIASWSALRRRRGRGLVRAGGGGGSIVGGRHGEFSFCGNALL